MRVGNLHRHAARRANEATLPRVRELHLVPSKVTQVIGVFFSFILCRDAKTPVVNTFIKVDINVIISVMVVICWDPVTKLDRSPSKRTAG